MYCQIMLSPENLHTDGLHPSDFVVKTFVQLVRDNFKTNKKDVACCDITKRSKFVNVSREPNPNHDVISFLQENKTILSSGNKSSKKFLCLIHSFSELI